jgi:DNA-binding transcriptional LysR family regulator
MVKRRSLPPPLNVGDAAHALQLLVAIADLGSLTAAGDRLALTPSAVSKAVARTEARLGVQLVKRTTRRVALTDHGEAYVARGRRVLAEIEAVERDAASREWTVRGVLRVSAPTVYGAMKVAPVLVALQREPPALDVHLRCEDRMIDMVVEHIGVAVRILATPAAELVARPLADDRRGLDVSLSYLQRAPPPEDAGGPRRDMLRSLTAANRRRRQGSAAASSSRPTVCSPRVKRRSVGWGSSRCRSTSPSTMSRRDACARSSPGRCRRRGGST